MPTLESTDNKIAPKRILRHRPIGETAPLTRKRSIVTTAAIPLVQRASRPRPANADDEVAEWRHTTEVEESPASIAGRQRATASKVPTAARWQRATFLKRRPLQHTHPLFYLGIGMLAMLALWTALSALFGWFTTTLDDLNYGRPRTFQTDAWVGHNEQGGAPSHFIALNLHGHIEVIEMPGGDATHVHVYIGPQLYGPNSDLVPVTLRFLDVSGDHKPDMLVTFQGTHIVFINDQGQFRPVLPSERHQVEDFLQKSARTPSLKWGMNWPSFFGAWAPGYRSTWHAVIIIV
jgi:hypothetical protein